MSGGLSRSRVSSEQVEVLVSFMEEHPEFAAGKLSVYSRFTASKLWRLLAERLNAAAGDSGGAYKSPDKWCRVSVTASTGLWRTTLTHPAPPVCCSTGLISSTKHARKRLPVERSAISPRPRTACRTYLITSASPETVSVCILRHSNKTIATHPMACNIYYSKCVGSYSYTLIFLSVIATCLIIYL